MTSQLLLSIPLDCIKRDLSYAINAEQENNTAERNRLMLEAYMSLGQCLIDARIPMKLGYKKFSREDLKLLNKVRFI